MNPRVDPRQPDDAETSFAAQTQAKANPDTAASEAALGARSSIRVSVIINNYDYGRFVGSAIESGLAQDWPDTEVVVVDDGSTDGSVSVIEAYGSRITAVLKPNGGQGSAINLGFAQATGDVIILLDADDVLFPNAARVAAQHLADDSISRVYWPMAELDASGHPTDAIRHSRLLGGDLAERVLEGGPYAYEWPPTSGNAWQRSFLEAVLPVPEHTFTNYVDNYLSALSPLYGTHAIASTVSGWRRHGSNETMTTSRKPFCTRLEDLLGRHDACLEATRVHAALRGYPLQPDRWRGNSWVHRLNSAVNEILACVPDGERLALIDEDRWDAGGEVCGRPVVPVMSTDGTYGGIPANEEALLGELDRLSRDRVSFLAIAWTSMWWVEYYAGLDRWLKDLARPLVTSRDLLLYGLERR